MADLKRTPRRSPDTTFIGYHTHDSHGSVEVFFVDADLAKADADLQFAGVTGKGWYWWPCHPGCLPDGDCVGPFPTAEGAYLSAQEE